MFRSRLLGNFHNFLEKDGQKAGEKAKQTDDQAVPCRFFHDFTDTHGSPCLRKATEFLSLSNHGESCLCKNIMGKGCLFYEQGASQKILPYLFIHLTCWQTS